MLKPTTEEGTGGFSAVPGNLGSFMSSIQQAAPAPVATEEPLEEENEKEINFDEEENPGGGEPQINWGGENEPERKVVPTNVGRATARFTDRGMAFAMGLYAHDSSEKYRASEQEFHEIEEAFADFLNETGINISPAVNLIIALSAIYVFKFGDVHRDRVANIKRENEEKEAERQRKALEAAPGEVEVEL